MAMSNYSKPHLQAVDEAYLNSQKTSASLFHTEEVKADMTQVSREEIQALLAANKAEMESIASSIRVEMALSRENTNVQFATLNSTLSSLSSKIEGKMDSMDGDVKAINGRFEGLQGQISGINTAVSGIQSGISTRLTIFGMIIAVLVALPGIISAFKDSQPASQQPIIIQVPSIQTQPEQKQPLDLPSQKHK